MSLNDISKEINKWAGNRRLLLAVEYQLTSMEGIMEFKKKNHYLSNKWFSQELSIDAKIVGRSLGRIFSHSVKVFFHKLFMKREK